MGDLNLMYDVSRRLRAIIGHKERWERSGYSGSTLTDRLWRRFQFKDRDEILRPAVVWLDRIITVEPNAAPVYYPQPIPSATCVLSGQIELGMALAERDIIEVVMGPGGMFTRMREDIYLWQRCASSRVPVYTVSCAWDAPNGKALRFKPVEGGSFTAPDASELLDNFYELAGK